MEVQECKGVHGKPGACPKKLGDLEEPKNKMAVKPTKTEGKVKGAGADKEFREVRVRKKGH